MWINCFVALCALVPFSTCAWHSKQPSTKSFQINKIVVKGLNVSGNHDAAPLSVDCHHKVNVFGRSNGHVISGMRSVNLQLTLIILNVIFDIALNLSQKPYHCHNSCHSGGNSAIRSINHLTHQLHFCKQRRLERRPALETEPLRAISPTVYVLSFMPT